MNGEKQSLYTDVKNNFFQTHIWNYRTFLLVIILGAMVNNLEHSADLYMKISSKMNELQAYSVVIIFDLIVIALIGVGDSKALIFAISVFFINELSWDGVTVFYQVYKKAWDVNYTIDKSTQEYLKLIEKGLTMFIYGSTFAFTVHHFSYMYKAQLIKRSKFNGLVSTLRKTLADLSTRLAESDSLLAEKEKALAENLKSVADMESKLSAANEELTANQQQARKIQDELEELRNFKTRIDEELTCVCGVKFETMGAVHGHKTKCIVHKASKNNNEAIPGKRLNQIENQ